MNPMVLSSPWSDSLEIISLRPEITITKDEPNVSKYPLGQISWYYCFTASKKYQGIDPMGINEPRANSIEIISLQQLRKVSRD